MESLNDFVRSKCEVYFFSLETMSTYLLLFNTDNVSVRKVIDYFSIGKIELEVTEEEAVKFTIANFAKLDMDFSDLSEIESNILCEKYFYGLSFLVASGTSVFVHFNWNEVKLLEDAKVIGVFLENDKENLQQSVVQGAVVSSFVKHNVNIMEFFEEDKIAEDLSVSEDFNKEFDDDELEQKPIKKIKKKRKASEDEMEFELDEKEKKSRRRRMNVDEDEIADVVRLLFYLIR
jgi:hypothetical protein